MDTTAQGRRRHGFTLVELLVVVGLVTVLISLLLPALGNARKAAYATACASNLRQMGTAWVMYVSEHKGRLPEPIWLAVPPRTTPEVTWQASWLGILDSYKVRGQTLLCPSASEPIPFAQQNPGFGNVAYAWSGRFQTNGTSARFNTSTYRDSSYGYNHYLVVGGPTVDGTATRLNAIRPLTDVPVFMDAVYAEFTPVNFKHGFLVEPPPNLSWNNWPRSAPDHWRFLIARHGRGINVFLADGAVRRVPLEEMYQLTWRTGWTRYRLELPLR